jgi:hypothetical protein
MRPDISGCPALNGAQGAGAATAPVLSQEINDGNIARDNSSVAFSQPAESIAARHIARKHLVRLPIARLIAAELGLSLAGDAA